MALQVARETLGEATRSREIAEADRRAAESDRKAAEADRKKAEADRRQARTDRELDHGQRLRDGQREGLLRIAEILQQIDGLAWNDCRYNPPTGTWLTGRHLLAAALVGTCGLSNCEAILNVDQAAAAMSGVATARQELKAALAKNAEATARRPAEQARPRAAGGGGGEEEEEEACGRDTAGLMRGRTGECELLLLQGTYDQGRDRPRNRTASPTANACKRQYAHYLISIRHKPTGSRFSGPTQPRGRQAAPKRRSRSVDVPQAA